MGQVDIIGEAARSGSEIDGSRPRQGTPAPRDPAGSIAEPEDWGMRGHDAIMRIPVAVRIVLGAARLPVSKLMSLTRGSIIPLDRKVGDLVDIVVNDRIVARGEIVVLDQQEDRFAVSIREVVSASDE